nr:xylulokinase [Treponema sp.]
SEEESARLLGKDVYALLDQAAEKIPVGSDRLLYLPYLMGERTPHLDPSARGAFVGLSALHTKAHLLRALMEGVSFSQMDSLLVLKEMGINISSMLACGGGGTSSLWRQMLCDVFNLPVATVASKEGPALGVALLAAVGSGVYSSVEEACKKVIKVNKEQKPVKENVESYKKYYQLYRKLYPALKSSYSELSQL